MFECIHVITVYADPILHIFIYLYCMCVFFLVLRAALQQIPISCVDMAIHYWNKNWSRKLKCSFTYESVADIMCNVNDVLITTVAKKYFPSSEPIEKR